MARCLTVSIFILNPVGGDPNFGKWVLSCAAAMEENAAHVIDEFPDGVASCDDYWPRHLVRRSNMENFTPFTAYLSP